MAEPAHGNFAAVERVLRSRARRQPAFVRNLARALALVTQFSTDASQTLGQLDGPASLAAVLLWTPASNGANTAVSFPPGPFGCALDHTAELEAAAQRATDVATPLITAVDCPVDDHQVYAVPATSLSGIGQPQLGALAALSGSGQTFTDSELLLLSLTALRLGDALYRERPGQDAARQADVRGRLLTEVMAAAENERKRIAHDIHDDTLQVMGMQLMKVQIIQRLAERGVSGEVARELEALSVSIQENADRLRAIMSELRPSTLRDYGLLATIDGFVRTFTMQTGVPVSFASRLGRRLPDDHETMVYRIVQEALTNIRKHAGATEVKITLEGLGDWYTLSIEDNGRGFVPQEAMERSLGTGHFGLITMRERAELIGGSFAVESAPGAGTRLQFHLPRLT